MTDKVSSPQGKPQGDLSRNPPQELQLTAILMAVLSGFGVALISYFLIVASAEVAFAIGIAVGLAVWWPLNHRKDHRRG